VIEALAPFNNSKAFRVEAILSCKHNNFVNVVHPHKIFRPGMGMTRLFLLKVSKTTPEVGTSFTRELPRIRVTVVVFVTGGESRRGLRNFARSHYGTHDNKSCHSVTQASLACRTPLCAYSLQASISSFYMSKAKRGWKLGRKDAAPMHDQYMVSHTPIAPASESQPYFSILGPQLGVGPYITPSGCFPSTLAFRFHTDQAFGPKHSEMPQNKYELLAKNASKC
jgi:hypothetical protein